MSRRKTVPEMDDAEFGAMLAKLSEHDLRRIAALWRDYDPYGLDEALISLKLPGGEASR